jgi:hypothetical protein
MLQMTIIDQYSQVGRGTKTSTGRVALLVILGCLLCCRRCPNWGLLPRVTWIEIAPILNPFHTIVNPFHTNHTPGLNPHHVAPIVRHRSSQGSSYRLQEGAKCLQPTIAKCRFWMTPRCLLRTTPKCHSQTTARGCP